MLLLGTISIILANFLIVNSKFSICGDDMFSLEPIRNLCHQKGCTIAEIERDLGIGNGVIAKWEKGKKSPPVDTLRKIAEYFDVTIDYICGGQQRFPPRIGSDRYEPIALNIPEFDIPEDQAELNDLYMMLNDSAKANLISYARYLASVSENLSKNNADTTVSA